MTGEHPLAEGRFSVLRTLGAGGMGVVYEVFDNERRIRVAVKALPNVDATTLYLFKNEFRALAGIAHPNLAELYELFSVGKQWFFTMELVRGADFLEYVRGGPAAVPDEVSPHAEASSSPKRDLWEEVTATQTEAYVTPSPEADPRRDPPLDSPAQFDRLRSCTVQLIAGMEALHNAGKLHRDIKPSNVLVTRAGRVVLLDFGLVMDLRPADETGAIRRGGTFAYMAPEQWSSGQLTPAADLYALGSMLYRAIAGRLPFGTGKREVLAAKLRGSLDPPSVFAPHTPPDLDSLCMDLMRLRPEERPRGSEVAARLGAGASVGGPGGIARNLFIGRDSQMAQMRQALEAVRGGRAVSLFLHGASGMGKSTLLDRFLREAASDSDAVILAGRCYEQESVPYKAVDGVVDRLGLYLSSLPKDSLAPLLPGGMQALAQLFPVLSEIAEAAPAEHKIVVAQDRQELRRRAFRALRELLARLGERKTLIVVIDDLQWGDPDSAVLLTDMLAGPYPPVLLLIGAYRRENADARCVRDLVESNTNPAVERRVVAVDPLEAAEARRLASELFAVSAGIGPAAAESLASESGGNPYFLTELANSSVRGGAEAERSPAGLDEILWRRVTSLPEASQRLLEAVAVCGTALAEADLYELAGLPSRDPAALHGLRAGHLVRSTGPTGADLVETYHDRVREAVVQRLDGERRRDIHRRTARVLDSRGQSDPEILAFHFDGAGEPEKAAEYYAKAGGQAASALAFDRAAKLFGLAVKIGEADAQRKREWRIHLADALANAGKSAEAAREYESATPGAPPELAGELERRAALQYCMSGHMRNGVAALRTVLRRAGARPPGSRKGAIISWLFNRMRLRVRGLGFRERSEEEIPHGALARVDAYFAAAEGLSMVDVIHAASFQTRHLLLALKAGEPYRVGRALALEAIHSGNLGTPAWKQTTRLREAAAAIAQRTGHPHLLGMRELATGFANFEIGQWSLARRHFAEAEKILRERCTGVFFELMQVNTFILWNLIHLGEFTELAPGAARVVHWARERGDVMSLTNIGVYIGPYARLAQDDPRGARAAIDEALSNWTGGELSLPSMMGLHAQTTIDLYEGSGLAAWERFHSIWPQMKRSELTASQYFRSHCFGRYGFAALAGALQAKDPAPLRRAAEWNAGKLEKEKVGWTLPQAELMRAALAHQRGANSEAIGWLRAAVSHFEENESYPFLAAARRRLAALAGGRDATECLRLATEWESAQGIRNPEAMADAFAPGFRR